MPAFLFKMMMKRRHQKYPLTLGHFEIADLHDHRQRLHHKDSADDGQKDFLFDNHRNRTQSGPQRQRTHIAHENLGGIGVVPEETQAAADHCPAEDCQFTTAGHIVHLQIVRNDDISGNVGKYQIDRRRNDGRSGGQAVQTVGEIYCIGSANYDDDRKNYIKPAQIRPDIFRKGIARCPSKPGEKKIKRPTAVAPISCSSSLPLALRPALVFADLLIVVQGSNKSEKAS